MNFFLAAKLTSTELMFFGTLAASVVSLWSYSNWRAAVKVAIIIALFEGAIRKWLMPGAQELAYFLKDIFLFGAYLKFMISPDLDVRSYKLNLPVMMLCILGALLLPPALNTNIGSFLLALYGLKIYLYYIPLVFMMPYLFRNKDEMVRQLTWFSMLAIPICILGVLQFRAGAASPLNVYAQTSSDISGFGFGEKVRITGTFSYITGHSTFIIFFSTLCIALLAIPQTRHKWVITFITLPLLAANSMMNGSRSSMYTVGLIVIAFLLASMSGRLVASKNFTWVLGAGVAACMAGGAYFFYEAYTMFSTRAKVSNDNIAFRAVEHPLWAIGQSLQDGGIIGFGIGMAHPATEGIRRALKIPAPRKKCPVYDMEVGQIIVEVGPVSAVAWYALRFILLFFVWKIFFRCRDPVYSPILLMAALLSTPYMLMGVVYNHTSNILLFATIGLACSQLLEPLVKRRYLRPQAIPMHAPKLSPGTN
jgi:uncharacterized membrane protein YeaQ/YmgE (transglycosylase-associated protein family)